MRAVVQTGYGSPEDVLRLAEVDEPVPGDGEVLVRVRAASVHVDVWHVVTGRPYVLRLMGSGVRRPKRSIPGTDLAGQVESAGRNATRFQPGDAVFGEVARTQWQNGGTFAEYSVVPQEALALKPDDVTFEQAASVPTSGGIALNCLRLGRLSAGRNVLVNGAGGAVGSIAVQAARAEGARVTGVDHGEKLEMIRWLGADHVIDYTREDFTRGGERYDLILDVASTLSLGDCKRALTPDGLYVMVGHDHFGEASGRVLGSLPRMLGLVARGRFDHHLPAPDLRMPARGDTVATLRALLDAGSLTPLVGRTFPLGEVPAALRSLQEGRVLGRIVINP
ncbi:MAG TPA: NAD(P)-dependent alcohol dehydrogenase [Terriglobales bacterium]|nr:NAD(P)-dependent alcohol dehydrogenase [Terriglobales bacterium]